MAFYSRIVCNRATLSGIAASECGHKPSKQMRGASVRTFLVASFCLLLPASALLADVSLTAKSGTGATSSNGLTDAEKAAIKAANVAKAAAKHSKQHGHGGFVVVPTTVAPSDSLPAMSQWMRALLGVA